MSFLLAILLAGGLSPVDLKGLEKYEAAWGEPSLRLVDEARAEFGNRGVEIAQYFLRHTEPRPRNDAYFFVLRAVGDTETALVLIRALPNPPVHESGVLDRDFGEIEVAIRAMLETNDSARADPRIVSALLEAVATARAKPYGTGMHTTLAAIGLLGLCRSTDAAKALQVLAADPDAQIRTAVANALGNLTETRETQATQQVSRVTTLLHILEGDANAEARRQAAESLGSVNAGEPKIVAELRSVLRTEKDAQVVDAIIQGLYRQGAPIQDPEQCRELIARAWDAFFAKQMLDCWRVTANPEELLQAALVGPPIQRAVALDSQVPVEPPTPLARSLFAAVRPEHIQLDPTIRDQLLNSAVDVLSQKMQISDSTREMTHKALWRISGMNMELALRHADRVTPTAARFQASASMAQTDIGAYDARRRSQQLRTAVMLAFGMAPLLFFASLRRGVILFVASALAWGMWCLQESGVRALPPPPLVWLSTSAIAFLSAGAVTAAVALVPWKKVHASRGLPLLRVIAAVAGSGAAAFVVCASTRNARIFPIGSEGWELIFEPLGSFLLAVVAAAILATVDGLIRWSRPLA